MERPAAGRTEGFRGTVIRGTDGVPVGSVVRIDREGDGWHLFLTGTGGLAWDVWCDTWLDAEEWFTAWAVTWEHAPE